MWAVLQQIHSPHNPVFQARPAQSTICMLRIVITFGAASTTIWGTATIMRTDATEIKASHAGATRGCDVENETLND
jgi:hypothetical protein